MVQARLCRAPTGLNHVARGWAELVPAWQIRQAPNTGGGIARSATVAMAITSPILRQGRGVASRSLSAPVLGSGVVDIFHQGRDPLAGKHPPAATAAATMGNSAAGILDSRLRQNGRIRPT